MLVAVAGPAVAQPVPPVPTPPPVPSQTAPAVTNWGNLPPPAVPPAPLPAATAPFPGTTTGPRPQLVPADPLAGGMPSRVVTYQKLGGADTAQQPPVPGVEKRQPRERILKLDPEVPFQSDPDLLKRIARELEREARERQATGENIVTADYYRPPVAQPLVPAGTPYRPKTLDYPPAQRLLEPGYVVHRRLYFEELNSERYGWDLGFAQPVISTLHFWKDGLLYPARAATNLFERYDASAGKCVPGSPVPYFLYPPEVNLFGASVGAGAIIGVAAILP